MKKPKEIIPMKEQLIMGAVKYYTWTRYDKSAVACLSCLYHFALFLYFVIAMSE